MNKYPLNILLSSLFAILLVCPMHARTETIPEPESGELEAIRGLIKPATRAVLSSEIAAQIEKIPYRDGQSFRKGDLLVQFDCALYRAAGTAASAEHEASVKRLENKRQLLALDAVSDIEVELAAIAVKKTRADVDASNINVSRCRIKAPYDGRVIETVVNEFESVGRDQELISILDDQDLEIELIVPSKWLIWLDEGIEFDFHVDETGRQYRAGVTGIGAVVDPVSQTVRIKGRFSEATDVLSGMSGTARFIKPVE